MNCPELLKNLNKERLEIMNCNSSANDNVICLIEK
jgi:hypothetical protein